MKTFLTDNLHILMFAAGLVSGWILWMLASKPKKEKKTVPRIYSNPVAVTDKDWVDELLDPYSQAKLINSSQMLTAYCAGLAKQAGWDLKPRETGTELMLMVSEIAEAMEGDRKNLMDDHLPHRKMLEVELADLAIRLHHFAGKHKLDLAGAIVEKLLYNTQREDHKLENREKTNGKKY